MFKNVKTLCMVGSFVLQAAAFADCPAVFDEVEPGFCDRQANAREIQIENYYRDREFNNYNYDERYPYLNFRPMYQTAPIGVTGSEAALMVGVAASAILVFNKDEELMDFVQDNKNDITEVAAFYGEKMGSMPAILGAGGYVLGLVMDNGEIKSTSLMVVKTALVSGMITRALKMSFSRKRPNVGDGAYEFAGFDASNEHVSFPSGHTTTAFAFATVIAETYKDKSKLIPVLAYTAAAIGGWSRVHDEAHWGSDVLVGALIGHLTAKKMMNGLNVKESKYDMSFYPVFGSDYNGFHFEFRGRRKKDDSAKRFFEKCHKYYEENPSYEDPKRLCMGHYFQSVMKD